MSRVADELGTGASFGRARPVSARRAAAAAVTDAPTTGVPDPTELPVKAISHNPDNPRDHLRNLDDMTQSVIELGVINAITVATVDAYLAERPDRAGDIDPGARYLVVDGHRRLEAARRGGKDTIKVTVDDARVATDESLLEAAFVANYHRDGMTELEEAHALESLVKFYGNQSKASQRLGIAQSTISSKLSVLKLAPELQADLADGRRKVEHVRNLGKLSPEQQRAQADARQEEARREAERAKKRQPDPLPAREVEASPGSVAPVPGAPEQSNEEPQSFTAVKLEAPEVPVQRPEPADPDPQPAVPVKRPQIKMPWDDGHACAEIAIRKMDKEQLARMIDRLLVHVGAHTGQRPASS